MRRFALLIGLAALLCGCGGQAVSHDTTPLSTGTAEVTASPAASASLTLQVNVRSGSLPVSVRALRVSGFDENGAVAFGPRTVSTVGSVTLPDVPASVLTVRLEGLGAVTDVAPLADFVTSVAPTNGVVRIDSPAFVDVGDRVQRSFVVMGCNRLNYGDRKLTPSSANAAQLVADYEEIPARFSPAPELVFFTGDLVMAEEVGTDVLTEQLTAWKALFAGTRIAATSTRLAAMPGNHEMLTFSEALNTEIPNPPSGAAWSTVMAEYLPGADGPTQAPPNPDGVQRDESRLSYTFRSGSNLYMVVNTETWEGGMTSADVGKVPLRWVQERLALGQADPTVTDIFVFGHKPVGSNITDNDLPSINPTQAVPFYNALAATPKVRGYFCAHAHLWENGIPPNAPAGSTLQQLIAGNAGSSVDELFLPPRGYFGYTVVSQTTAGRIVAESWGRPVPVPYHAQTAQPPSTIRERFTFLGTR